MDRSGYGDIFSAFALSYGAPTALHFAKWLALLLPAVVLALPFAALARSDRRRELLALVRAQRINPASIERDGLSRFRDALRGRYTELLLSQVYAYLAERRGAVGPHYLVSPTDNLERAYALIDLDLEDAVLVIANRAGVRLPSARRSAAPN